MRPLRPFCGTVLNAQLLILPAIWRISAPGVVTTQLSSVPPASSSATDVVGPSDRRLATAHPPEPPPTTMKSKLSMALPPHFMDRNCLVLEAQAEPEDRSRGGPRLYLCRTSGKPCLWPRKCRRKAAIWPILAVIKSSKVASRPFPKQPRVGTYRSHPEPLGSGCLLRKPPDGKRRLGALAKAVSDIGFSARLATI